VRYGPTPALLLLFSRELQMSSSCHRSSLSAPPSSISPSRMAHHFSGDLALYACVCKPVIHRKMQHQPFDMTHAALLAEATVTLVSAYFPRGPHLLPMAERK
jgi:hypothetical protein